MNPIDSNEQLDDNLVDKNTEQYIKLQSIAKETQSNLQSLLSRYCHRSSSNANTDTVQSSTASILDKFDRLIASVNELQHSSEKRECSENLSDALEKIKLQWHSTHCQSKNVISMMESRVQDAKLDLITAMNNNNQLFCEFVQKAGAECSHASTTMQEIVRSTAEDCYRKKEQLIQGTEAELAEVLHTYHEVKRCLLDDRQSTRGLQSIAMIEFYAQHHHDAAKLHRHLNQQVIDLFLQLQQEKIECLLARNELKYNCRVMEERKYENKQALLLQHHRCTAAANLAILKGEYARQRDAAEAERDELARDAHKCLSGMQELHAKARRFAKSHAIEISKVRVRTFFLFCTWPCTSVCADRPSHFIICMIYIAVEKYQNR